METLNGTIGTKPTDYDFGYKREKPNVRIGFGEAEAKVTISFIENYTLLRRFKWWLFCKVFPFRLEIFKEREKL